MNRFLDRFPHARDPLTIHNKYSTGWNKELSFWSLRDQGLVNCYEEWRSLKTAFYYKRIGPENICKWLNNQKGHFRVSYLSHTLISGYGHDEETEIPLDVGNIICLYCNITFIKLYDSSNTDTYSLRTFDANITINNLAKILELDEPDPFSMNIKSRKQTNCKRIWSRLGPLRYIYSMKTNEYKPKPNNIDADNGWNRWVEIPSDLCSTLTIRDIDDELKYNQILELGVDTLHKTYYDRNLSVRRENWTFTENDIKYKKNCNNRLEWLCSLEIGDMVNVCKKYGVWMEAYIKYRDYDTFYLQCIGWNGLKGSEEEVKSVGSDLDRLQKRYAFCEWIGRSNRLYSNVLVYCDWITAFAGNSMSYPILFE